MSTQPARPSGARRLAAIGALVLVAAVVVVTIVRVVADPWRTPVTLLLLVALVAAGWFAAHQDGASTGGRPGRRRWSSSRSLPS